MNYTELAQAVTDYLQDKETSFADNRDLFIRLGERRIYTLLKLPSARANSTGNMTASNRFLSLPSDVLAVLSMQVTDGTTVINLLQKDMEYVREAYPNAATEGTPAVYSIYDQDTALIGPTPDDAYVVEMTYHTTPTSIVDTGTTTWLGDNFDRLLLFAALVEGYTYMKGDEDLQKLYEQNYREEAEKASVVLMRGAYGGDEYRRGAM